MIGLYVLREKLLLFEIRLQRFQSPLNDRASQGLFRLRIQIPVSHGNTDSRRGYNPIRPQRLGHGRDRTHMSARYSGSFQFLD